MAVSLAAMRSLGRMKATLLLFLALVGVASAQFQAATLLEDPTASLRVRGDCHHQSIWRIFWSGCVCAPCDHCHLDVAALQCERSDDDDDQGSSQGSNGDEDSGLLDQPILDPEAWFLNESEVTASRGGIPRQRLALWTEGNAVTLFTATNKFFASLFGDLEALPTIDIDSSEEQRTQVMLTGWSVDNIPFMPQLRSNKWNQTTFRHVFGRAIRRGADVRALVWANTLEYAQNAAMQDWMNAVGAPPEYTRFLFDGRVPYAMATHHQKTVILFPPNGSTDPLPTAYVGGIDLTNDRWDTRFHNESWLRRRHDVANNYEGWIDASVRIQGRAVQDVANNFYMRWNSPMPLLPGDPNTQVFENPPVDETTNVTRRTFPDVDAGGSVNIQVVRTFSCKVGYDFAPKGEISLMESRIKAISLATNYIYVEDQYFVHVPPLRDALLAQLPKLQALVVVAQLPELTTTAVGYGKLFYDMVAPLLEQFPDKVRVFIIRPELQLYIHTKVVLIDDVYLSVGSANWNRRSMTSDSEIAAAIVDSNQVDDERDGIRVGALPREFRLKKFREFSGLESADLANMTLLESVQALDAAATNPESIIKPVDIRRRAYFDVIPKELINMSDPFDQC